MPRTNILVAFEDEEGDYAVEADVVVHYDPGTPRWKGSIYSCPSDIDWYGAPPSFEGVEAVKNVVVYHDGAPKGEALTGQEFEAAAYDIVGRIDSGEIDADAALDSALDDYEPPLPDEDWRD